jgi:hypothetical protein
MTGVIATTTAWTACIHRFMDFIEQSFTALFVEWKPTKKA